MSEIIVTQVKSAIGRTINQRRNLRALGLRKIGQSRKHKDCPEIRGIINKVNFLIEVKKAD